jgi:hypothetical protein
MTTDNAVDDDPHMDSMLKLHGDNEAQFWTCNATARQMQLFDMLGLSFSLVTNLILASSPSPTHTYKQCCVASAVAIVAQMLWSLLHRRSYVRCRVAAMAAQRLRWYCIAFWLCTRSSSSPWDTVLSPIRGSLTTSTGTWRVFAAVAGYPPIVLVHQFFSFPLPYRHALVSAAILLVSYPIFCLHQQIHSSELLKLQRYIGPACMATPVAALPTSQHLCSSKAGHALLLAYLFVLVGVLLPLQLVHWQERSAKEMFLRSRGVRVLQRDGAVPTMLIVTVWAIAVVVLAAVSA